MPIHKKSLRFVKKVNRDLSSKAHHDAIQKLSKQTGLSVLTLQLLSIEEYLNHSPVYGGIIDLNILLPSSKSWGKFFKQLSKYLEPTFLDGKVAVICEHDFRRTKHLLDKYDFCTDETIEFYKLNKITCDCELLLHNWSPYYNK